MLDQSLRSRLEEEFLLHRDRLRDIAKGILRSPDLADEVIQDAYLKVVQLGAATNVRQPLFYCSQIVRNLAMDSHRRRTTESAYQVYVDDVEELGRRIEITPERILAAKRALEAAAAALATLPSRSRNAFLMSRNEGMTQREIGRALGCSATLVNFMIRDAEVAIEASRGLLTVD